MRLFVAVWPPPPVVDVVAALDRPAMDGVRWTGPAQWHVTLQFLGEVGESTVSGLVSALASAAAGLAPATAVLGSSLASFGPSVLYVPVDGLAAWASAVEGAVAASGRAAGGSSAGSATERVGPFVGHLTVGRGRRGRGAARGDVRPLVGRTVGGRPVSWVAEAFTLERSELGHGGATYTTVASFPVGGDHPHTNVRSQLR